MALKAVYETKEDIPEQYVDLFTERNGQWELTGIEGIKTQGDVDRLQSALTKERSDHKDTKDKLKKFDNVDLDQVEKDQDELVELRAKVEAGAGESFNQEKFDEAVEKVATARVKTETAPLKRELERANEQLETITTENVELKRDKTNRVIKDAVVGAASKAKIIPEAMEDVQMYGERLFEVLEDGRVVTRDNVGVTPGIEADIWLGEMQEKRPHWWPSSVGGGAGGGSGGGAFPNNPFSAEHWNMTKQGEAIKTDRAKAERMAEAAGTKIGGPRPIPKSK